MEGSGLARTQECDTRLVVGSFSRVSGKVAEILGDFFQPTEDGLANEGANLQSNLWKAMKCDEEKGGEGVVDGDFAR